MQEYYELRDAYLKKNKLCEVCFKKEAMDIHHKAGRGQNLLKHFLAVCRECHSRIEDNPAWAIKNGYSIKRHIIQTTEPPEYGC